jgi:hypothetical protein
MTAIDNEPGTLQMAVAERLRMVLAAERTNKLRVGDLCNWGRGYMHRRYVGETPLDVNDLETLERDAGISMQYLLTGEGPRMAVDRRDPRPASVKDGDAGLPDPATYLRGRIMNHSGRQRLLLPRKDSNLQPFGLRPRTQYPRFLYCVGR